MYIFLTVLTPPVLCYGLSTHDNIGSQQTMICNDLVTFALDSNCQVNVLPEALLETPANNNFTVEIYYNSNLLSNPLDGTHAAEFLNYTVTDVSSGNNCSGQLVLLDFQSPEFVCPSSPVLIDCADDPDTVPMPECFDNCSSVFVYQTDEFWADDEFCDGNKLTVIKTFSGVDLFGNQATPCQQVIEIQRLNEVDFPNDISWSCEQYASYPSIVDSVALSPIISNQITGTDAFDASQITDSNALANTGSGIPLNVLGTYCNFSFVCSDINSDLCGGGQTIIRTWLVLDWCTGEMVTSNAQGEDNIQIITVEDNIEPEIIAEDLTLSANISADYPDLCKSQGFIPAATISDNCSEASLRIFSSVGELNYINGNDGANGGMIPAPGLELGTHVIVYKATDMCGNEAVEEVLLEVIDDYSPTLVVQPFATISLTNTGFTEVNALSFDQGTTDNCCLDKIEVKKNNDACGFIVNDTYSESVFFCCDEAGTDVSLSIRATDCYGNYNEAIISVSVQDNLNPTVEYCPEDQSISCSVYTGELLPYINNGDYTILEQYGLPVIGDNCFVTLSYEVEEDLNDCNEGTISRLWTVGDSNGNSTSVCQQEITVVHSDLWGVVFPEDKIISCMDEVEDSLGYPTFFDENCSFISVSYSDEVFSIVPDACYNIIRKWTVLNWCTYNAALGNSYIELSELESETDYNGDGQLNAQTFSSIGSFPGVADGIITYNQLISIIDENAPVVEIADQSFCLEGGNCSTNLILDLPEIDDCSASTTLSISTNLPVEDDNGVYNDVGPGTYWASYQVFDGCGNESTSTVNIIVEDCSAPVLSCMNMEVNLDDEGQYLLENSTLGDWALDNCSTNPSLSFSPLFDQDVLTFDCDGQGIHYIDLYSQDESGNISSCQFELLITDPDNNCIADDLWLSGYVMTENYYYMPGVDILMNNNGDPFGTNTDGAYTAEPLMEGEDYSFLPSYNGDVLEGVTTLDIVFIQKHILMLDILDTPYKLLAADVNKSNNVSTLDIVALRRVILGLDETFPNNDSWRFIPEDFEFIDSTNPFLDLIPFSININDLSGNEENVNFFAIKVGDVNGTIENQMSGTLLERNNSETYPIFIYKQESKVGNLTKLLFKSKLNNITGLQGRLLFNTEFLQVNRLTPVFWNKNIFNHFELDEGRLTFSWNEQAELEDELLTLFELELEQSGDLSLEELIMFDQSYTNEAYDKSYQSFSIDLSWQNIVEDWQVKTVPNPFEGVCYIYSEQNDFSGEGNISVYDIEGRLIHQQDMYFEEGTSKLAIEYTFDQGVYFYVLRKNTSIKRGRLVAL